MIFHFHKTSLLARLRDTRGFMIAEQLISIIFIGLLCIAVTAGLQVAMNSYGRITTQTQADSMLSQAVEVVSDELVYALSVEADNVTFVSATRHESATLRSGEQGIWLEADGTQYNLAPTENGLSPTLSDLSYDAYAGTWSFRITIQSGGSTLADTTMTVKRIGS
ncbi:hypothetical protein GS424_000195 [Eggerthella guodeyinii]|uniref:Type II secretion system protein n=1 Tax=Eggerthella guodeyinii TaxID=2690837 RepID=A0A6L7IP49_9ACTN|nr:hypothetical protein [Eggerthella guodeyinii]QOS68335.1 hypothetical protein GS424_000195 [Eggerthella guodeyinii]